MIDTQQGRGILKIKLGFFFFFMLVDLILSTFVEPHFNPQNIHISNSNIQLIVVCVVQIAINLILNVMFLVLMWQTVPLRYGMIFDLIKQFKLTIFLIVVQFALNTIERVLRIINSNEQYITYTSSVFYYYIIYYIKYIIYPFYYANLLQSSLKLALPVYYNVKKWDNNL
ncbi:hypothetical protein ABPG72_022591 [Tetrahymena utriculariae]